MRKDSLSLVTSAATKFDARHAEAGAVVLHQFQPGWVGVAGNDFAVIVYQLRDERGLAAGRGAQIQYRFAGLRAEHHRREQRAGVLQIKPAVTETAEFGQRRM